MAWHGVDVFRVVLVILVVGATGSLGGMIARRLLARDHAIRILIRGGADASGLVAAGAESVRGDLRDASSLRTACAGATAVVTTATAAGRPDSGSLDSVDRTGNRNLVEAAVAAGVRHFVFVSAFGADVAHPVSFLRAKAETEGVLRRSSMSWTLIRPEFFMDTWVPVVVGLPALGGRPVHVPASAGERVHCMVAAADVAAYTTGLVQVPSAANRVVPLGGPEALTWFDVVGEFERQLDRRIDVQLLSFGERVPGWPVLRSSLLHWQATYSSTLEEVRTVADGDLPPTRLSSFVSTFLRAHAAGRHAPTYPGR